MGGRQDSFPCGIMCDKEGKIVALEWNSKGLNGNLSPKLGKLPQLERLYGLYSVLLNLFRELYDNQLNGTLDVLDSFENLGNLRIM